MIFNGLVCRSVSLAIWKLIEGFQGLPSRSPVPRVYRSFLRGTRFRIINRPIAERAGEIRGELRARGRPVDHRTLDILVAATALHHDLTLVTRNIRHFSDVPHLRLFLLFLTPS